MDSTLGRATTREDPCQNLLLFRNQNKTRFTANISLLIKERERENNEYVGNAEQPTRATARVRYNSNKKTGATATKARIRKAPRQNEISYFMFHLMQLQFSAMK